MAEAPGPQPNFNNLNNAMGKIATELARLQNLSQIANVQAILDAIAQLQADVKNRLEGLEERLTGRIVASTRNNIARIQNSTRALGNMDLVPLVNAVNGNPINGFPANIGVLNSLNLAQLMAILNALGEQEDGDVRQCRTRLSIAIGVVIQTTIL